MPRVAIILSVLLSVGYANIPEKVIVCGVCKDVQQALPSTLKIMEKIGALFEDSRIIIYENNSTDKTPLLLNQWSQRHPNAIVYTEKIPKEELLKENANGLFVPECIARARNIVLNRALEPDLDGYKFLIWVDMDFTIEPNYEGFYEVFDSELEWDAVFANGRHLDQSYYDWYALRDDVVPLLSEHFGDQWELPRHLKIDERDDWYPVYSAFSGCGIYRKASLEGCYYSGTVTHDLALYTAERLNDFENPYVQKYFQELPQLKVYPILKPEPNLPKILNPNIGIRCPNQPKNVIWRMSFGGWQYPTVCEHVSLHAAMIARDHDKLFICPRLIFTYDN